MNQTTTQRITGTLHLNKKRLPASADDPGKTVDLTRAGHGHGHGQGHADADSNPDFDAEATAAALPHERDEQVGMTGGVPSPMVQQAARDVEQGIKDTSRSEESNAAYEKLKSS